MTRDHANLQRQPFLTPIWLTVIGALLGAVLLVSMAWVWGTANSTTVIVIRHAEKRLDAGANPPLTAAGEARAALLSRMFGDAAAPGHVDAIYSSAALRNRMTAAPLAARLGIEPVVVATDDARALARRVVREHAGGRILVIGHRDTVTDIVAALGGDAHLRPIEDSEYGIMYIVSVPRIGRANLLRIEF